MSSCRFAISRSKCKTRVKRLPAESLLPAAVSGSDLGAPLQPRSFNSGCPQLWERRQQPAPAHPPPGVRERFSVQETYPLHGLQPTGLLCSWGFSRQEYWSGLPWTPTKQRALLYNLSNSIPRRDIFTGSL